MQATFTKNKAPHNTTFLGQSNAYCEIEKIVGDIALLFKEAYLLGLDDIQTISASPIARSSKIDYCHLSSAMASNTANCHAQFVAKFQTDSGAKDDEVEFLSRDNAILDFEAQELSIIDQKQLSAQLKLEQAYTSARESFQHLLINCSLALNKQLSANPTQSKIESISPTTLGILIQDTLYETSSDRFAARVAYRFTGWHFFEMLIPLYAKQTQLPNSVGVITPQNEHSKEVKKINVVKLSTANRPKFASIGKRTNNKTPRFSIHKTISVAARVQPSTNNAKRKSNSKPPTQSHATTTGQAKRVKKVSPQKTSLKPRTTQKKAISAAIPRIDHDCIGIEKVFQHWHKSSTHIQGPFSNLTRIEFDSIDINTKVCEVDRQATAAILQRMSKQLRDNSQCRFERGDIVDCIQQTLKKVANNDLISALSIQSERSLNLISAVFDTIKRSDALLIETAGQVDRLQVSVIQIALQDDSMLRNTEHPVRQFLRLLCQLCQKVKTINDPEYTQVKNTIDRIINHDHSDYSIFEAESLKLKAQLQPPLQSVKSVKSSTPLNTKKADKNTHTITDLNAIGKFLDAQDRTLNHTLLAHALLRQVWEAILLEIVSASDADRKDWDTATKLYRLIIRTTQIEAIDKNRKKLATQLITIIKKLEQFLSHYHVNTKVKQVLLDCLMDIHMQIIKGIDGTKIQDDLTITIKLCGELNSLPLMSTKGAQTDWYGKWGTIKTAKVNLALDNNGYIYTGQATADTIREVIDYDHLSGYCDLSDMGDFGERFDQTCLDFSGPRSYMPRR